MKKDEEKFINDSLKALKDLKTKWQGTEEALDQPVLKKVLPFLLLEIRHVGTVIDEYIKQFEELKK